MRNFLMAVVLFGVGGYFGAKIYIQHKAARDVDGLLAQMRPVVDVQYERVVATIGGELRLEDVTIRLPQFKDPVQAESVGLITPGFMYLLGFDRRKLEVPDYLGVQATGVRASVDADYMRKLDEVRQTQAAAQTLTPADECASTYGLTRTALKELGYRELVVDLRMSFRREGERLVLDFGMDAKDMYDIAMSATLDGVADPTALARGARPLLVNARLDYVDQSLNERIVKRCADRNVSRDELMAAQLREIQAAALAQGVELDAMLIEPYTDFLSGKRRFTVISAPHKPVDLTRVSLYKPSDVPNLLNLTAEAG